jgi:hypothetical protein
MPATDRTHAVEGGPRTLSHFALLTTVLVIAATLRLVAINSQGLWGDEGLTLSLVHWPLRDLLLEPVDPTPALYYALHKALGFQPDASAGWIRSIAFVCGLAAVGLMYLLGRLALGARAGLLAAALLAVWPGHIDHSQEARSYALLFVLTLASATSLLWWHRAAEGEHRTRRIGALACFVLTTALSFYAHMVAVFWILLALQIFLLTALTARPKRIGEAAAALVTMAVLAVPGLIRIVRQFGVPTNFNWLRQATPSEFLDKTANVLLPFESWWLRGAFVAVALGLLWAARKQSSSRPAPDTVTQLILLAFLFLPVLIWGFGFSIRPIFMERTILFAIPGSILAIVALVNALPGNRLRDGVAVLSVAAIASTLLFHGTMRPREDWRGAHEVLARDARSGDVVLLCAWQFPSLRHAAVRPLPVPLVYVASATPLMFERTLGERPDWDRIFFRYDLLPVTRQSDRGALVETKVDVASGGRLWLVESDCPEESRAAVLQQVGGDAWQPHWASAPTRPERAEIRVSRKVATDAITFPALIPPEVLSGSVAAR